MSKTGTSASRDNAARRAQRALAGGNWQGAAALLGEAARTAVARGERQRAAHCEQMAASLYRAAGSLEQALAAAQRVASLDGASPQARFAAQAERAETLMVAGDPAQAVVAWREALREAQGLMLPAWALATVMRRHGAALAHSGQADEAWQVLDAAAAMQLGTERESDAAWIDIEQAQLALAVGDTSRARELVERGRVQVGAQHDATLQAECRRTRAECALTEGDFAGALSEATRARDAALAAVAPVSYFASSVVLARAAEAQGDRASCYRTLASAWVTLADLLGGPLARSWVEPLLQAYRLAWGAETFDAVRAAHDAARRALTGHL